MRERPILFSAPMVRAILDGSKTQTRRIVKEPDNGVTTAIENGKPFCTDELGNWLERISPYGKRGDRLWVRETFCQKSWDTNKGCYYRATDDVDCIDDGDGYAVINKDGSLKSPWKPSIHMPRWASRITLEITNVRVERLQDISEDDAIAEGCSGKIDGLEYPSQQYKQLWNKINGDGSWAANPWVWVIDFKRVEGK